MATNDITGDRLRSRPNNKAFEENFERIFGSKNNGGKRDDIQPTSGEGGKVDDKREGAGTSDRSM